jgi:exopolysaccharide biosynthesis protein
MKSSKNPLTGSLKGKYSVYLPEKRLWIFTDTKKEADDYVKRLKAKDASMQVSKPVKKQAAS